MNNIRWKKSDYITLGKTISKFNKEIQKLQNLENKVILPEKLIYKNVKQDITTRQELNRIINSLRRFSEPSKQKTIKLTDDILVTNWELIETKKLRKRATKRLSSEFSSLTTGLGTGNTRINEIYGTLEKYSRLEKPKDKEDYKRIRESLYKQGKSDYEHRKNKIFYENFISAYKKMGRNEIVKIAESFNNYDEFWNFIEDSNLVDLQERYDEDEGLVVFSIDKEENYQQEINNLLSKLK